MTKRAQARDVIEPHRRLLLKGLVCWPVAATAQPVLPQVRSLSLQHLHTDERLDLTYFSDGGYLPQAIAEIERVLRDFRTGEIHEIDLDLLDTMHALVESCGGGAIQVIGGYRSPATNAQLQATTEGVAPNSLHMEGRAVDIRLKGFETVKVRDAAVALGRGGVGYYAQSDFIHLDTGRVRRWG